MSGKYRDRGREITAVPSIFKAVLMKGYHFSQLKGRREGERLDFTLTGRIFPFTEEWGEKKEKNTHTNLLFAAMSHPCLVQRRRNQGVMCNTRGAQGDLLEERVWRTVSICYPTNIAAQPKGYGSASAARRRYRN